MIRISTWNRRSGIWVSMLASLLFVLISVVCPKTVYAESIVLKVGYSDSDGIIVDEDGNHSGYAVDYLEEIAKYTGWKYEFVCDTWSNGLENLEQGK